MIPYYCNEAMLLLPNVRSLVDRTRQVLEIVTEEGAKIDLVIARAPVIEGETLRSGVDAGIAEQKRSLRGFELVSVGERQHGEFIGVEVRFRFVDKSAGPLFHSEFHSVVETSRIGFHGMCRLAYADACDAWMQSMLSSLKLRA